MAAKTLLLYHDDPLLLEFESQVVAHGELGGRASVLLPSTAFYPESGGQMADRGTLGGAAVADVQIDEAGVVHHVLDGALPPVGTSVSGRIDRARRRAHMALHTGQHLLSRALLDVARAETVSSRLGETTCTVDVGRVGLDERIVLEAETLANSVVDDDVPAAVEKLRRELGEARDRLGRARSKLAEAAADQLIDAARASGDPHMVAAIDEAPVELLRAVATRLCVVDRGVALLAGPAVDGSAVVVARAGSSDFDCGAFMKRAAAACGGKGGGRPERAEGRLPPGTDWVALVRSFIG